MRKLLATLLVFMFVFSNSVVFAEGIDWSALLDEELESPAAFIRDLVEEYNKKDTNSIDTGMWAFDRFLDKFQQPTGEPFIKNKYWMLGSFSNSAVTNEDLYVLFAIDRTPTVVLQLQLYGDHVVKNNSGEHITYVVTMRDASGKDQKLYAYLQSKSSQFVFSEQSSKTIFDALKQNKTLSFYLERDSQATIENYLFTIKDTSNFELAWNMLSQM